MSVIRDQKALLHSKVDPWVKPEGVRYYSALDLILTEGVDMSPNLWTYTGATSRSAHGNAVHLAVERPDRFIYVEGLAVRIEGVPLPEPHAWLWDLATSSACEISWSTVGVEYLGIPFKLDFVRGMALLRDRFGILDHPIMLSTEARPEKYRFDL